MHHPKLSDFTKAEAYGVTIQSELRWGVLVWTTAASHRWVSLLILTSLRPRLRHPGQFSSDPWMLLSTCVAQACPQDRLRIPGFRTHKATRSLSSQLTHTWSPLVHSTDPCKPLCQLRFWNRKHHFSQWEEIKVTPQNAKQLVRD